MLEMNGKSQALRSKRSVCSLLSSKIGYTNRIYLVVQKANHCTYVYKKTIKTNILIHVKNR